MSLASAWQHFLTISKLKFDFKVLDLLYIENKRFLFFYMAGRFYFSILVKRIMTMQKKEFVEKLAEKLQSTKAEAEKNIDAIFELIT